MSPSSPVRRRSPRSRIPSTISPLTISSTNPPLTISPLASPSTSTVPTAGVLVPAGQPIQVGGGASGGASAGATAGSSSLNTLPDGVVVSQSGTATQAVSGDSATGAQPQVRRSRAFGGHDHANDRPACGKASSSWPAHQRRSSVGGAAGATAGGTVASPSISTLPASINVGPGGGPSLVATSGAANSPMVCIDLGSHPAPAARPGSFRMARRFKVLKSARAAAGSR